MKWFAARPMAAFLSFAVIAGCQGVPADYKPDPKLKSASIASLKSRVQDACVVTQRAKASTATPALQKSCGCYASRTMKELTPTELTFYRETGYFNETARAKGQGALSACGLQG